jgi:uncharacterized ferritin-like protein (DUF455 family)
MFLQTHLKNIILTKNFNEKISFAEDLNQFLNQTDLLINQISNDVFLKDFQTPGRPNNYQVLSPKKVPLRKNLDNLEHRINFLHAIANIELLAIELPILCLLRFGSSDNDFIKEQIRIIMEEALHFEMLKNRLSDLGCEYGSIPVHHGLWDFALTCVNELEHQILIPCYLEARGLDVCPEFIEKFKKIKDFKSADILQKILNDEVGHVKSGNEYLKKKAKEKNTSSDDLFYKVLTEKLGNNISSKTKVNKEYRLKAGFSKEMISFLE